MHRWWALALIICAPAAADSFRLSDDARPLSYTLSFDADPEKPTLRGSVTIELELAHPSQTVYLSGSSRVHVDRAEWRLAGKVLPAAAFQEGERLRVAAGRPVEGRATLFLSFTSQPSVREADGLFRRKDRGGWALFSHFEPLRARNAFPCFDEPRWKARWRVSVRVPNGYDVLSNMPLQARVPQTEGRVRFDFAESPPLPSYLVALAVGHFSPVEGGTDHIPVRTVGLAAGDLALVTRLLQAAERRFGRFPFPKLDVVAVPYFDGAMENAGLITIDDAAVNWHQGLRVQVLAHEIAHQWFGDLVTCAWFDDVWLNESLAEWLSIELAAELHAGFRAEAHVGIHERSAIGVDVRGAAHTIRVAPKGSADVMASFHSYTYGRGAGLMSMLEGFLGRAALDRALGRYLAAHAYGTVTTADLIAALSKEAGRDLGGVLHSYLDQPGLPWVEAHLTCDNSPRLELRQRPLTGGDATWRIPFCAGWEGGRACTILDERVGQLPLGSCRGVSLPPAGDRLYVLKSELDPPPVQLSELRRLMLTGAVEVTEVLPLLPKFLDGPQPPLGEAVGLLAELSALVRDPLQLHWRRYLRSLRLVRRLRALGDGLERDRLASLLISESVDPELARELAAHSRARLRTMDVRVLDLLAGQTDARTFEQTAFSLMASHHELLFAVFDLVQRRNDDVSRRSLGLLHRLAFDGGDPEYLWRRASCDTAQFPPGYEDEAALCARFKRTQFQALERWLLTY